MSLRLDDPNSTPSGTMQAHLPPTFNIRRKAHKNIRKEIVEKTILEGKPVERLFYKDHDTVCPHPDDIPFLNQQTRIVLENCGKIDAESIDEYIAVGGYQALAKVLGGMTSQEVIDEVTKSGLRGRGGAGFPAGKKWSQVARQAEKTRYVVCNGDEGDPGAFMDGSVMEGDPYKMIEGMTIAVTQ